jgi:flagellar biosynthesis/type III secretory pathway chaperone
MVRQENKLLMTQDTRIEPPRIADEKTSLVAYLDYQRQTIINKLDGLSEADARRAIPPSTLTLLGLVKHLAYVD